jgi:hypothetical protein
LVALLHHIRISPHSSYEFVSAFHPAFEPPSVPTPESATKSNSKSSQKSASTHDLAPDCVFAPEFALACVIAPDSVPTHGLTPKSRPISGSPHNFFYKFFNALISIKFSFCIYFHCFSKFVEFPRDLSQT